MLYSARVEMTCFSGEKDSFSAARKIVRGSRARGCAKTPVDGPSRWVKTRSAGVSPAILGARASRPQKQMRARCPRSTEESASTPPANLGARASRPQFSERGRPARHDQCGQDARAPQRKRPQRRPQISERGRPARNSRSAGVSPATTNAGKMPALHRGSGLNAVRKSRSAGVPPAIHPRTEKPRERGSWCSTCSTPRPGVKRRASRPPKAEKARQRAFMLRRR